MCWLQHFVLAERDQCHGLWGVYMNIYQRITFYFTFCCHCRKRQWIKNLNQFLPNILCAFQGTCKITAGTFSTIGTTITATEANNDTYGLQKRIEKFPLKWFIFYKHYSTEEQLHERPVNCTIQGCESCSIVSSSQTILCHTGLFKIWESKMVLPAPGQKMFYFAFY